MLKIKNKDLIDIKDFLYALKLKPKLSRHRTKLVKLLETKVEDVVTSSKELISLYAKKDENGEPIMEGTRIEFESNEDYQNFVKEDEALTNEESLIDLTEYPYIFDSVKQALEELDIDLSDKQAETYDLLCNLFDID